MLATHQLPNCAEDGSLLGEYPMEANPATAPTHGAQHIWLPTANGPMPIAVVGESGSMQCMRTT